MDALFKNVDFTAAYRVMSSNDLAIKVRYIDFVAVDDVYGSDAAACKGFCDIATDSAHSKYSYAAVFQPGSRVLSKY